MNCTASLISGVGEADWLFKTSFDYRQGDASNVDLVFEGLDTYCDITLVSADL